VEVNVPNKRSGQNHPGSTLRLANGASAAQPGNENGRMERDELDAVKQAMGMLDPLVAHEFTDFDQAPTALATACLARGVYLSTAACHLAATSSDQACAVLLRPAIEAWIYCCDIMYRGFPAMVEVLDEARRQRGSLAAKLLGSNLFGDQNTQDLDGLIGSAKDRGLLDPEFVLPKPISVRQRLNNAVAAKGAPEFYRSIYDSVYSPMSAIDTHVPLAIEYHIHQFDGGFATTSRADEWLNAAAQIQMVASLLLSAAQDLLPGLGHDVTMLGVFQVRIDEQLRETLRAYAAVALEHEDMQIRGILARVLEEQGLAPGARG